MQFRITERETTPLLTETASYGENPMNTTITSGQMTKILMLLHEQGVTPETAQLALENGMFADCFKQVAALRPDRLAELIARGKYDWVNSDITPARFPVTEIPELKDEKLFSFGRNISTEDAKAEMDKQGYRPATMAEQLVYGAKNPDAQRKNPIVALGSVARIDSFDFVGVLREVGSKRWLYLDCVDGVWGGGYRFLAVRK